VERADGPGFGPVACIPDRSIRLKSDGTIRGIAQGQRLLRRSSLAGLEHDVVPGSPGAVELADVRQLVMCACRRIPAAFETVPDELQESGASAHLDQEP